MNKGLLRSTGETLARFEDQTPEGRKMFCTMDALEGVLRELSPQAQYPLRLAYYIQWLKQATTIGQVRSILGDARRTIKASRLLVGEERTQAMADPNVAGLLAFVEIQTWGPGNPTNTSHQALMLNARTALGRIG